MGWRSPCARRRSARRSRTCDERRTDGSTHGGQDLVGTPLYVATLPPPTVFIRNRQAGNVWAAKNSEDPASCFLKAQEGPPACSGQSSREDSPSPSLLRNPPSGIG